MTDLPDWQIHFLGNGGSIFVSLLLALLGLWLAKQVRSRLIKRFIHRKRNQAIKLFLVNVLYGLILVLALIIVLSKLGVPTASLVTILGTSSLAIGLALKDFMANIAAGAIIVFQKPFEIGDLIEISGVTGTVEQIDLFSVRLKTPHNEAVTIPNGILLKDKVINKAYQGTRRLELNIGIAYEADITAAKTIIQSLIADDERILTTPKPVVGVSSLGDSAVNLVVWIWVPRTEFNQVKMALLENIKMAFDTAKIKIPYPQREVWLQNAK